MSRADAEAWLERVRADRGRIWFVIISKQDDRVIGEAGLLRIVPAWRCADMTIILGEKDTWRKGYGSEVARLLMDLAFGTLNLHRLGVGIVGSNEAAIRFYQKLGFRKEGVQRDGHYHDHRYVDFVMMSVLEDEFLEGTAT
jgi:RimJ/RimL family protein N-acetyltransferase